MASLHSQVSDLLGEDSRRSDPPIRLDVAQARRVCAQGQLVVARQGRVEVVVVGLPGGRTCVVQDVCPHNQMPLSDGYMEHGLVVCPRHGWTFDPETGRRVR